MAVDVLEKPIAAKGKRNNAAEGVIEVKAGALAKTLRQIAALVEKRNTVPVLACVRLKARADGLHLQATDLDSWIEDVVPPAQDGGGEGEKRDVVSFTICASAHKLFEAADALPTGATVRLTLSDKRLRFEAASSFGPVSYRMPTWPAEDFPTLPALQPLCRFDMPAFTLTSAIDAVRHAISTEETRYYLNGIFFHVPKAGENEGRLVLAATDGHRLARWRGDAPAGAEELPDAIVARKTVALIGALIDRLSAKEQDEDDLTLEFSVSKLRVKVGSAVLTAKLIDGTFPDYSRVIPTANDKDALVSPGHLLAALRQVTLLSSEKTRAVKCHFEADRLTLIVNSVENGEAEASLPCRYAAEPLTIGFNAQYLADIVRRMGAEECRLLMADPSAPTHIINFEGAASDYTLMTMRV